MNLGLYCEKTDFVIGGEIDFNSAKSTFDMDPNIFDYTADYYILRVKNSNGDTYVLKGSIRKYMIGPGMYACSADFHDDRSTIDITFDEYDGGWTLSQVHTVVDDVVSAEIYKSTVTKIPVEYLPIDSDFLKIPARSGSGNNSIILNLVGTANGGNSVSEGYNTETNGENSHSEGYNTETNGENSHSEGYYTDASGINQHVQGKYNIKDTNNKYAHIVGNGTWSERSNAHTLDWDGNAWFAGEVKVGGTGQDDIAAKTLAKTEDIPAVDSTLTQTGQAADAAIVGNRLSSISSAVGEAEQHARVAQECAQAMAGTFDFTGYLRYQIVNAAPETYDEGVLYIVTTA